MFYIGVQIPRSPSRYFLNIKHFSLQNPDVNFRLVLLLTIANGNCAAEEMKKVLVLLGSFNNVSLICLFIRAFSTRLRGGQISF